VGERVAYTSLAAAQSRLAPDSVTRFELHYPELRRAADDARSAAVAQDLQATLSDAYLARTWREAEPGLVAVLEVINPLMYVVTLIFFVLAGLLVLNTMYLSLIERVREFGVLSALGASRGQVVRLILTESLLLCLTGAAIGLSLGLALVGYLSRGFSIPGLDAYYESFGLNPVFYPSVSAEQVAFAALFTLCTALLSALWPALIAARLEPVEAMRHTA
jgi:ABC-type antimicrobial peptide transport system permease subunit